MPYTSSQSAYPEQSAAPSSAVDPCLHLSSVFHDFNNLLTPVEVKHERGRHRCRVPPR